MSRTEIASRLAADLPLVADHPNGATHVRVAPLTDADLGVPNRGIISLFSLLWQRLGFGARALTLQSDSSRPPESGGNPPRRRQLDRRFAMSAYWTGSANDARPRARVEPAVLTVFRPGRPRRMTSASSARLMRDSGRPMTFIAGTK